MKFAIVLMLCALSIYADETIPFEIRRIKDARQQKIKEINKQYIAALQKQKKIYIKRNDLKSANLIDAMLVEISDENKKSELTEKLAKIYSKDRFMRFENGKKTHPDGIGVYVNIPQEYDKWKVSVVECKSKEPLIFKVKEPGIVLLVMPPQVANSTTFSEWKKKASASAKFAEEVFHLTILEKYLDAGEYKMQPDKISNFGVRLLKQK